MQMMLNQFESNNNQFGFILLVIEHRLRAITRVSMNQFGFMLGRSTMEAIFLIRQAMERYREKKKDLHMVFIDLEKAYDKIQINIIWWVLDKHKVLTKYVGLIKKDRS